MLTKYASVLCFLAFCSVVVDISSAQDDEASNQNPVVKSLAKCISNHLQDSKVLGSHAKFAEFKPYDMFYRVSVNLLDRAGFCDPALAKSAADAGDDVGLVTSKLYFDTIGYMLANFLFSKGLVNPVNYRYYCLKIVSSIELVACQDGLTDTESVMNAVVYGFYNVLEEYGFTDYETMVDLFCLFTGEIESL